MYRIGQGWDRHPLEAGRRCILGGVEFQDSPVGPVGHSDGDAVCHAITDAILGAASLGDIGRHFPDTDSRWAGANSLELLREAVRLVQGKGFRVVNVDCTVITEQPVIAPQSAAMQDALAGALQIAPDRVSVKATRGEGLGPEGRGECVTVQAVALLMVDQGDG
jgi:2-C-methyl-D-erythritol 2,4-cyclodiphosphate synthase